MNDQNKEASGMPFIETPNWRIKDQVVIERQQLKKTINVWGINDDPTNSFQFFTEDVVFLNNDQTKYWSGSPNYFDERGFTYNPEEFYKLLQDTLKEFNQLSPDEQKKLREKFNSKNYIMPKNQRRFLEIFHQEQLAEEFEAAKRKLEEQQK